MGSEGNHPELGVSIANHNLPLSQNVQHLPCVVLRWNADHKPLPGHLFGVEAAPKTALPEHGVLDEQRRRSGQRAGHQEKEANLREQQR